MHKRHPVLKNGDFLRNEFHIAAEVRCADGSIVRMRYNNIIKRWEVYSEICFYVPMSESNNAEKLSEFIKKSAIETYYDYTEFNPYDIDPCDIPTVVDDTKDIPSKLPGDPLGIRKLMIYSHMHTVHSRQHDITTSFEVTTAYIPYNENEYTDITQWFKHCAQLIVNRVARELVAHANIDGANITISRCESADVLGCKYMRYAEFTSDMVQQVAVTIGIQELPEFRLEECRITFTFDDEDYSETEKIYSEVQDDLVFLLWGMPVYFTKSDVNSNGIVFSLNSSSLRKHTHTECDSAHRDIYHSFILSLDKSTGFIEFIRQHLTDLAFKSSRDNLYECMSYLVTYIAEQLKQNIAYFFGKLSKNTCIAMHSGAHGILEGVLLSELSIQAKVFNMYKYNMLMYAEKPTHDSCLLWGSEGGLWLHMHQNDSDCDKMEKFLDSTIQPGFHEYPRFHGYVTLIDADAMEGSMSKANTQQFVHRLMVKYKGYWNDSKSDNVIMYLKYKINTQFTSYGKDENMTLDQWFRECAVMLANRVITEVAQIVGVPCNKLLFNRDGADSDLDNCLYLRHVKYTKNENLGVSVEISYWEQPEFYIHSIKIAVNPSSSILYDRLKALEAKDEAVLVDNFPVFLYEAKKIYWQYAIGRFDLPIAADVAGQPAAIKGICNYIKENEDDLITPNMFLMNTSKSADYIQHVKNQVMQLVTNCSQEEMFSTVGNIAVCISKQFEQLLKK